MLEGKPLVISYLSQLIVREGVNWVGNKHSVAYTAQEPGIHSWWRDKEVGHVATKSRKILFPPVQLRNMKAGLEDDWGATARYLSLCCSKATALSA